jgi:predicted transcriptional regulator of viral defense system
MQIKITTALTRYLSELSQPVITDYELCLVFFNLFQAKKYRESVIEIDKSAKPSLKYIKTNVIAPLIELGIILPLPDFPNERVFQILGKQQDTEDIVCTIDPFAYISHLNAMAYHGLTNRLPKVIYLSTPSPKDWIKFANKKMEKDYSGHFKEFLDYGLPKLTRINFSTIRKNKIFRYSSIHQGAFKHIDGRMLRVSTIGRTFLDMLRKPDYCGSMYHVIDVFKNNGEQYSRLIIDEIERHGTNIEKARAGYLMEEILKIKDSRIDEWANNVQRGGSRKLDPKQSYREIYSERWCLSLNMDL